MLWQDVGETRRLPLIDADFRTALADEPLRLYRLDEHLAVAVGSVLIIATEPGGPTHEGRFERVAGATFLLGESAGTRYYAQRAEGAAAMLRAVSDVRGQPGVVGVWPDSLQIEIRPERSQFVQPHYSVETYSLVDALDIAPLWSRGDGAGVRVAIIDTAIDEDVEDLSAGPIPLHDPWPPIRAMPAAPPDGGHGTRVASVIGSVDRDPRLRGIAPGARLISIPLRSTWTSELIAALHQARSAEADIVVCAFELAHATPPVAAVVRRLGSPAPGEKGMLLVAAAGNAHADTATRRGLASLPGVLAVTALDHDGQVIAAFGEGVDIAAPSMLPVLPRRADGQPSFLGKTSSAAPVVAGVAALLLSAYPSLDTQTLREVLTRSAIPLDRPKGTFGALAPGAAFDFAARRTGATP